MRIMIGNFFILLFVSVFSLFFMWTARELSSVKSLDNFLDETIQLEDIILTYNSKILDHDGNIISDIYSEENRIAVSYSNIPSKFIEAFVAAEDQKFYVHKGFDTGGIARAFLVNLQNKSIEQGGSTLTQQLARNLYLTHSQTYERKLTELLYAYHLEKKFSKNDIMEMYLNTVYFSNGVYGIEAASNYYFSKKTDELSIAEIAFLSSIPNSPAHYNPLTNSENTHQRKEWILEKMHENQFITDKELEESLEDMITLEIYEKKDSFPDYVTYVHYELKQIVSAEEGFVQKIHSASSQEERTSFEEKLAKRVDELISSGITIETALNPSIQTHALSTINRLLENSPIQAATSIIDHEQAEIVAITGGVSYDKFNFHRGFQAYRQPGSVIKPLLVYAPLLEETSLNMASVIDAGPINRNGYSPNNFGGAIYGKATIETALKNSYNTAAVRMLDTVGIETAFSYVDQFNFAKVSSSDYKLPSALGGFEHGMTVNELTQAYSTFSTDGVYHSPKAIRNIMDADGEVLYSMEKENLEIWSEDTIADLRKMLAKVVSEGTGKAARLNRAGYTGGKTGTTNEFHDLWFIGMNDRYTTGLWMGKDEPSSLINESSQNLHTKLWRDIMNGIN
ncbi:penicillin-binding protein [Salipaludibacillus neizhouensis]|uniref:Penicillin-binding protein n=1 Tax=Salipaludibacillus neizhouensis TaxID=885475 RepID=A0A3A9JXH0_9BACI|nr:transglycosylase domain-containing protein [Salipaludibacillus neizhouensis]RKL65584.1 penicillin-binding protein [Salipaludibacillus neizhouensis]